MVAYWSSHSYSSGVLIKPCSYVKSKVIRGLFHILFAVLELGAQANREIKISDCQDKQEIKQKIKTLTSNTKPSKSASHLYAKEGDRSVSTLTSLRGEIISKIQNVVLAT